MSIALAILVTAGTIPVNLLAAERMDIYKAKLAGNYLTGHFRENNILKCQQLWLNSEDRDLVARLIPEIIHILVGNLRR